jgi:hypothetical protein
MLESIPGMPQFASAIVTGLGHGLGQRLIGLVLNQFRWIKAATVANDEPLLRKVSLADLNGRIPDGFHLCQFHETHLVQNFTDKPPANVNEGDALWLIPNGELAVSAEVPNGDTTADADLVVAFDPGDALGRLLAKADRLDRGDIGELVAAGLIAAVALPGIGGWTKLLKGDRKKLGDFRTSLDDSLRSQGIRCNQIREVRPRVNVETESKDKSHWQQDRPAPPAQSGEVADQDYLTATIGALKNETEWQAMQATLVQAGIPFDATASQQLAALRDETLKRATSPAQAVNRLAMLAAEAFERAGVHSSDDLARWQNVSQRLGDESLEFAIEVPPATPSSAAVAAAKAPSTWWIWNRTEVDRRRLLFVGRSLEHCWTACNQALADIRDLPALRQLRELREQLALARQLLETMPPLTPEKRALRVGGPKIKNLLKSLDEAVSASDTLSTRMREMLGSAPGAAEWESALYDCRRSIHLLIQNLNDRRAVR